MPTKPNTATFNEIRSEDGLIVDQTITTYYKAPKSFTGEDMVEISLHGGSAVINKFIDGRDSDIELYDIFNSPDVAYDVDFVVRLD